MFRQFIHSAARWFSIGLFAASSLIFAQDYPANTSPTTTTGGWKRVGDGSTQQPADATMAPPPEVSQQQYPQQQYPQPQYPQQQQQQQQQQPYPMNNAAVPAQLNVPAGTYLTVRVNQLLSSDKNQPGDAFSATLAEPLVVNGVVVAEPGQTIGGRVAEAQKAGRVEGLARLGIELTDMTLVDGQQLPVKTSLVSRRGPSSVGQDAGTIAVTTGLGAAIGAAADWGRGAAIGAGAGAAAGIIGVLVTRGHPSVIYPEQVLTFRLEAPLTIATDRSPQAFRYVQPNEYSRQPYYSQAPPAGYVAAAPAPYPYPYYASPYYGYGYGYGYPYYYGSSFSLFVGPGFYGRGYYGRGYIGGRFGVRR